MSHHLRRLSAAVVALIAATATLSACASSASSTKDAAGHPSSTADARLRAMVPASVRRSGVLRIATDASYAPAESFAPNGRTMIGFDPDLGAAIGKILGLRTQLVQHDFAQLLDYLDAGRTDVVMSAMTDTVERQHQADFVDYFQTGTAMVVQRGNPAAVTSFDGLCGLGVATEAGSTEAAQLAAQQKRCGRHAIGQHIVSNNAEALLLLRTGRVKAFLVDYPQAALLTGGHDASGLYQLASTAQFDPAPYGIAVSRTQPALRDAVRAALTQLMRDGSYRAILRKWEVSDGAVRTAGVNLGRASRTTS